MTNRRSFLTSLLACGAAPKLGWAAAGSPAYLAAAGEADGSFALYGLAEDGTDTFHVPLAARGHAGAAHPTRAEAVAFARRPGLFALVIDCVTGRLLHQLTPPADRHFNGHGGFALGGAVLFTREQDAATSAGVVGVWDAAAGYVRVGEFPSQGIGPHELLVMPDDRSLAVANGGIATDPTDRTKLNLATMRPNLSYLGFDGALLDQVELDQELWPNSIRHLAVRPDGLVGFAMQWEGGQAPHPRFWACTSAAKARFWRRPPRRIRRHCWAMPAASPSARTAARSRSPGRGVVACTGFRRQRLIWGPFWARCRAAMCAGWPPIRAGFWPATAWAG